MAKVEFSGKQIPRRLTPKRFLGSVIVIDTSRREGKGAEFGRGRC